MIEFFITIAKLVAMAAMIALVVVFGLTILSWALMIIVVAAVVFGLAWLADIPFTVTLGDGEKGVYKRSTGFVSLKK